ncbi:hypothetical protein HDU93_003766 [Gonapodya sp. JEL0774]|nr:hypothetical protein HDU93_003766 [Gonapodya sp. JEL0774]
MAAASRRRRLPILLASLVVLASALLEVVLAVDPTESFPGLQPGETLVPLRAFFLQKPYLVGGKGLPVYGDGFAFWVVSEKGQGPVFGAQDNFSGLGIFFDTYANDESRRSFFPYVMAMVGDGKTSYDKDKDGKANEIAGCSSDFRNRQNPTRARVRYSRDAQELTLDLSVNADGAWEQCFKVDNVVLPMVGYVGFSAHTGEVTDHHDILSMSAYGVVNTDSYRTAARALPPIARGTGNTAPLARNINKRRPPPSPSGSGRGGGWWKVLLALLVVGGAVAGIVLYFSMARGKSAKRF